MNKEETKIYNRAYYLKNKDKIKRDTREWELKNPDKVKIYTKRKNNSLKARIRKDKWIKNNPEKNKEVKQKSFIKHKKEYEKMLYARKMAQKIPLHSNCDICGSTKKLERHHWDYNKPLLVNTLCKTCHAIQHIKFFYQSIYAGGK